jgi:hypothetical protein
VTGFRSIDKSHTAITGIDASFEDAGRAGRILHDRHRQKHEPSQNKAGHADSTHKGDVHNSVSF